MEKEVRGKMCERAFRTAYFFDSGIIYIDKDSNNWGSYDQLCLVQSCLSLDSHYRKINGNKDLIALYPAIDLHVHFANSNSRELMFSCLGREESDTKIKLIDLFISSGFRRDVYFAFRRNKKSRNIIPIALLITTEPQSVDMDQYDLEQFYIKQRTEFGKQ